MSVEIPGWILSNIGGFLGFGLFSLTLLRIAHRGADSRRARLRVAADATTKAKLRAELRRAQEQEEQQGVQKQKVREKEEWLNRILPGPWRALYDYLGAKENMNFTREAVIASIKTFKNWGHGDELPMISPAGLNAILTKAFFNLPHKKGIGNCHPEIAELLRSYVTFSGWGDIRSAEKNSC